MKKLFLPALIVLLMLASVTPAFAKGHPPFNPGQQKKNQGLGATSESTLTTNGKPANGAEKLHGNSAKEGRNFVLFGTLEEVTTAAGDVEGKIKVSIISGNVAVHGFQGQDQMVEILVPAGAAIKLMQGDGVKWGTLEELKEFKGQVVRVHGWVTPEVVNPNAAPATAPADSTTVKIPGVWTASQVYTLSPEAQEGISNPDTSTETEQ
jgi:hypothetical protein